MSDAVSSANAWILSVALVIAPVTSAASDRSTLRSVPQNTAEWFKAGQATEAQTADAGDLPSVAAEFEYQSDSIQSQWRMWREPNRLIREVPALAVSEHWQRDGRTVFKTSYFHNERRGVEHEETDLNMQGALENWQELLLLVSPTLLERLSREPGSVRKDGNLLFVAGEFEGVHYQITLRTDLKIPKELRREHAGKVETLTLLSATPIDSATWTPMSVSDYGGPGLR